MKAPQVGALAATAGFAVMSLELAAIRLFAPYFGDSAYVWTNVIGVLLVALALGAWLGGRLADRDHGRKRLAHLFLIAAVLSALIPLYAGSLGAYLLPSDLRLDAAMGALVRGSLAATLLVFAPPVLMLGAVTPVLVTILAEERGRVGSASGLVSAMGTVGSLLGTFATTHLLVPGLGAQQTIWVCASTLFVCSVVARPNRVVVASVAVPLLLFFIPQAAMRAVQAPFELLEEVESAYQYLQVVKEPADAKTGGPARTLLMINEGLDSFHSVRVEGTPYTEGRYYDFHAVTPFLAGEGERPADLRVLSLGAAAGTFERIFDAAFPGVVMDSVEIDPEVVRLGKTWFDAFRGKGQVYSGLDARVYVERTSSQYDVVIVDAYERQIYIPAHVASREFFTSVKRCLKPGGIVSVNSGGRTFEDPVVKVIAQTMATVFGSAKAFRVPKSRNFMLCARKGGGLEPDLLKSVAVSDPTLQNILKQTAVVTAWRTYEAGDSVLTDDRPFLDSVQDQALDTRYGRENLWVIAGELDSSTIEMEAWTLLKKGSLEEAAEVICSAKSPTGTLRVWAGNCRWRMHDVEGAALEYRDALQLGLDDKMRSYVEGNLVIVDEEIAKLRYADSIASRNGFFAIGAMLLLAFAAAMAVRVSKPMPLED